MPSPRPDHVKQAVGTAGEEDIAHQLAGLRGHNPRLAVVERHVVIAVAAESKIDSLVGRFLKVGEKPRSMRVLRWLIGSRALLCNQARGGPCGEGCSERSG